MIETAGHQQRTFHSMPEQPPPGGEATEDDNDNIVHRPPHLSSANDSIKHPRFWCGLHMSSQEKSNGKNVYNYARDEDKEKTPMCQIAEISRYHKLKHEYRLLDESGPAHKKMFTVELVLSPDEIYAGCGASIKKAQQSAAAEALLHTSCSRPPDRNKKGKKETNSPPVLLMHVCRRLGLPDPVYSTSPLPRRPLGPAPCMFLPAMSGGVIRRPGPLPPFHGPLPSFFGPPFSLIDGLLPRPPPLPPALLQPPNRTPQLSPSSHPSPHRPPLGMQPMGGGGGVLEGPPLPPSLPAPSPPPPLSAPPRFVCTLRLGAAPYPPVTALGVDKMNARTAAAAQALAMLAPSMAVLEKRLKEQLAEEKRRALEEAKAAAAAKSSKEAEERASSVEEKEEESKEESDSEDDEDSYGEEQGKEEQAESEEGRPANGARALSGTQPASPPRPGAGGKPKGKSVISQVHECALAMKLTVEFEVIREEGRAHERHYAVRCRLSGATPEETLEATGEGKQKKEAKKAACAALVEQLHKIESSPIYIASLIYKAQKRGQIVPREHPKRKTITKDMKSDPTYGHQINPVSRLIQVMQARGEPEPRFEHLGETGQYKCRQFVVAVSCGHLRAEGHGPNKRLAKRAAAEAMLNDLGCAKPMPEPGKSLLKRRDGDNGGTMVNIGVFDPNDYLVAAAVAAVPEPVSTPTATPLLSETAPSMDPLSPSAPAAVKWGDLSVDATSSSTESRGQSASPNDQSPTEEMPQPRRRVTFNSQVAACPPPDDVTYPMPELAPLKSEMSGKVRRRGKDARRKLLTDAQRDAMRSTAAAFISGEREEQQEDNVFRVDALPLPMKGSSGVETATLRLERMAAAHRFSIQFTNLQGMGDVGHASGHFALITLNFDKPIVCHGSGSTLEAAHEDAALNVLREIAGIPTMEGMAPPSGPPPVLAPSPNSLIRQQGGGPSRAPLVAAAGLSPPLRHIGHAIRAGHH